MAPYQATILLFVLKTMVVQKVEASLERLTKVMKEAEKYDIDSQLKLMSSDKDEFESKQQNRTINRSTKKLG